MKTRTLLLSFILLIILVIALPILLDAVGIGWPLT